MSALPPVLSYSQADITVPPYREPTAATARPTTFGSRSRRKSFPPRSNPNDNFSASWAQTVMHVWHRLHSVESTRWPLRMYSGMRTSIGQVFTHAPQSLHFSAWPPIFISEKRVVILSGTLTGQAYLQK